MIPPIVVGKTSIEVAMKFVGWRWALLLLGKVLFAWIVQEIHDGGLDLAFVQLHLQSLGPASTAPWHKEGFYQLKKETDQVSLIFA